MKILAQILFNGLIFIISAFAVMYALAAALATACVFVLGLIWMIIEEIIELSIWLIKKLAGKK